VSEGCVYAVDLRMEKRVQRSWASGITSRTRRTLGWAEAAAGAPARRKKPQVRASICCASDRSANYR